MWAGVVSIVDVKKEEIHKKITGCQEYKRGPGQVAGFNSWCWGLLHLAFSFRLLACS